MLSDRAPRSDQLLEVLALYCHRPSSIDALLPTSATPAKESPPNGSLKRSPKRLVTVEPVMEDAEIPSCIEARSDVVEEESGALLFRSPIGILMREETVRESESPSVLLCWIHQGENNHGFLLK